MWYNREMDTSIVIGAELLLARFTEKQIGYIRDEMLKYESNSEENTFLLGLEETAIKLLGSIHPKVLLQSINNNITEGIINQWNKDLIEKLLFKIDIFEKNLEATDVFKDLKLKLSITKRDLNGVMQTF